MAVWRRACILLLLLLPGRVVSSGEKELSMAEMQKLLREQSEILKDQALAIQSLRKELAEVKRQPGKAATVSMRPGTAPARPESTETGSVPDAPDEAEESWAEEVSDSLGGLEIHGALSQGFLLSDRHNYFFTHSEDGTFEWNDMALNFSKRLNENLTASLQLYARDFGDLSNHNIEVDFAFFDYVWRDWLGMRVGRVKTPFGFYNNTRDIDALHNWALPPQALYEIATRSFWINHDGVDLYGHLSHDKIGSLDYVLYAGAVTLPEDGGLEKTFEVVDGIQLDDDNSYTLGADLKLRSGYVPGLTLSGSAQYLHFHYQGGNTTHVHGGGGLPVYVDVIGDSEEPYLRFTGGLEYVWNRFRLVAEYKREYIEMRTKISGPFTSTRIRKWRIPAFYVAGSYRFTDWFELGTYYSHYVSNSLSADNDDADNYFEDIALTTRFDFNEHVYMKVEGHRLHGREAFMPADSNSSDHADSWNLLAIKAGLTF